MAQSFAEPKNAKKKALVKKKIEDIKQPELIIKATYQKKKLSIPLASIDDKGITEIMHSHISRFEREILSIFTLI